MDLNRATEVNPEVEAAVHDQYEYHQWSDRKKGQGVVIREALERAALTIIANAPPSPDRSAALRKLREARMDANSAITHDGKY